jgi:hypothetical protein
VPTNNREEQEEFVSFQNRLQVSSLQIGKQQYWMWQVFVLTALYVAVMRVMEVLMTLYAMTIVERSVLSPRISLLDVLVVLALSALWATNLGNVRRAGEEAARVFVRQKAHQMQ